MKREMKKKDIRGKRTWLIKRKGMLELPGYEGSAQEADVVDEVMKLKKLKQSISDNK